MSISWLAALISPLLNVHFNGRAKSGQCERDKMAESTRVDTGLELAGAEPLKYFNGKQWFSAKRGEWIGEREEEI